MNFFENIAIGVGIFLLVVLWITTCVAVLLASCDDCPFKNKCNDKNKDNDFVPPCNQNDNTHTNTQNDFLW